MQNITRNQVRAISFGVGAVIGLILLAQSFSNNPGKELELDAKWSGCKLDHAMGKPLSRECADLWVTHRGK